ncbi:MAG TPA: hypothetical protein PLC48_09005 [Ferruginibacter sp.]|nr:hypothetical protein [Ferruginibacter sp.]
MKSSFMGSINKPLALLFCLWMIVQAWLLYTNGISTNGEAQRVIREAGNLADGSGFSTPIYFLYSIEIILVLGITKIGAGYWFIVLIHLLLNLYALFSFFRYMRSISDLRLAMIGSILLISCYPYQLYNDFIYTESIFFSLGILYSCYLLRTDTFSLERIIKLGLFLLLLCLCRPTGLFFCGASLIYWIARSKQPVSTWSRFGIGAVVVIAGLFLLNYLMGTGGGIQVLVPFREEQVICEVPTKISPVLPTDDSADNSIAGLMNYVTTNPQSFSRLAWLKTKAFFGLTRSYYSTGHNLFVAGYFYSLYVLIIFGITRYWKRLPGSYIFLISLAGIFWLAVIFSCDEWHNRFFLTLTPFIIMAAMQAFYTNKPAR